MPYKISRRSVLRSGALLCAAATSHPASAAAGDWTVAQIGPFSGAPDPMAQEINQGLRAAFAQFNSRGGIAHRQLRLLEFDDRFDAVEFARQLQHAMVHRPVALMSPVGSASLQAALRDRLFDSHDIVVLNAVPGAESLRSPGHPRLFHLRAGDRQQIERIVAHAATVGIRRLFVLHQNLPAGLSGMAVARSAGDSGGVPLLVEGQRAAHESGALAEAARKIAQAEPQAVLVIGVPRFVADAIRAMRLAGVGQSIFALSYLRAELLCDVAGVEAARGVGIAQTFPNPNGVRLPLHRDFADAMNTMWPELPSRTAFQMEGYLCARVLVEGLKRISGPATPSALARALSTVGEMDLGGFHVDFSRGNAGSSYVDLAVVAANGKLAY